MGWITFTSAKADSFEGRDDFYGAKVTSTGAKVTSPGAKVTSPGAKVTSPAAKVTSPAAKVTSPAAKVTSSAAKVGFHGPKNQCFSQMSPILAPLFNSTSEVKLIPWNLAVESALASLPPHLTQVPVYVLSDGRSQTRQRDFNSG